MKRRITLFIVLMILVTTALSETYGIIFDRFRLWDNINWKTTFEDVTSNITFDQLEYLDRLNGRITIVLRPHDTIRDYIADMIGEELALQLGTVYLSFDQTDHLLNQIELTFGADSTEGDSLFEKISQAINNHYDAVPYETGDHFIRWVFHDLRTELHETLIPGKVLRYDPTVKIVTVGYLDTKYMANHPEIWE